ncbi:D-glucarate permease [Raoultella terrigena]|uniref:D-glucarate permease n=1 Tax=Raoultella terrigena TaxID=577 RepID=A0A485CDJ9_RAOTE|nr:D-glucarate permease [Raoultella terrigena]
MLFIVTSFNYGDRATLSIAGSEMAKDIGLGRGGNGLRFLLRSHGPTLLVRSPAVGCSIALAQNGSIFGRSSFGRCLPLLQGFVDIFSGFGIIIALFTLRFLVGLAEAPSFPGNSRIVAAWFPAQERGTAVSIF